MSTTLPPPIGRIRHVLKVRAGKCVAASTSGNGNNGPTLREFFERKYRPLRLLGGSPKTAEQYKTLFNHLQRHLGRPPRLNDLTTEKLCAWLMVYNGSSTMKNKWRQLAMALARFAVLQGMLKKVPDVPKVKAYRRNPVAWTLPELETLLATAAATKGNFCEIPAGRYWLALCLVAYWTGLRPGAVWQLRWADLNQDVLHVWAETQKQAADQVFRLHPQALEAMEAIRRPSRELIFPWPWCQHTKFDHFRRILKRAGLPTGHKRMFKALRVTCATLTHANGGDATWQLGHSDNAVTRRHYLDPTNVRQATDVLPRPEVKDPPPEVKPTLKRRKPKAKRWKKRTPWLIDAKRIQQRRCATGLTIAQCVTAAGIGKGTWYRYEMGFQRWATTKMLHKIATVLGCSIDDLAAKQ